MQDIPYIDKLPENFEIKKEDIIYVHRADPNRKMEYHFKAPFVCAAKDGKGCIEFI